MYLDYSDNGQYPISTHNIGTYRYSKRTSRLYGDENVDKEIFSQAFKHPETQIRLLHCQKLSSSVAKANLGSLGREDGTGNSQTIRNGQWNGFHPHDT